MSRTTKLFKIGSGLEFDGQPPAGKAGVSYSYQFKAKNGTTPYAFTFPTLPSGWSVSGGNTLVNASPSAGTFTLLMAVSDRTPTLVQKTFQVMISA